VPGADLSFNIRDIGDRGLRSPRHIGSIPGQQRQYLMPFMAAPLRPGETLVGASIKGRSDLDGWVQLPSAPLAYAECCLWLIPLPTLGNDITELLIASGEDVAERTSVDSPGTGASVSSASTGTQGHRSPGLIHEARPWAGEIGGDAGGSQDDSSAYMPYVSRGTWKVAYEHYDLEYVNRPAGIIDDDQHDAPPTVENYVRSVQRSMFDLGMGNLDADVSNSQTEVSWFSELVERLYLLSQAEMTYAEYLAAHGVDPRKSAGISALYMMDHGMLAPSSPQLFSGVGAHDQVNTANETGSFGDTFETSGFSLTDRATAYGHDRAPLTSLGRAWDTYRTKPVFIDAPSILLGTMVYWIVDSDNEQFAHLGMPRMTHPGHWGNRAFGDVDESDFIGTQSLYKADGDTLITDGDEDDQGSGVFAMNLLNLFLHGDEFHNHGLISDPDYFTLRKPGGSTITPDTAYGGLLNSRMSVQLHVLSDLVG
jgi:hypothetical protein